MTKAWLNNDLYQVMPDVASGVRGERDFNENPFELNTRLDDHVMLDQEFWQSIYI
jgi:hypothetical protein